MFKSHRETHYFQRIGWLRAAILGANDGIISTSSLILGVAMATSDKTQILISGLAALVAGAMSMAAGEYVSVSSQSDLEKADIARETKELIDNPDGEMNELAGIYIKRGLEPELAKQVARQMTQKDALGAHLRDELHITEVNTARPIQAAWMSAVSFASGALLPVVLAASLPQSLLTTVIPAASLVLLALLGLIGAYMGGAVKHKAVLRILFWSAAAMAISAWIGNIAGIQLATA